MEFGILDPKNIYFDMSEDFIRILLEMLTFGGHDHIYYDHLTCKHGQNGKMRSKFGILDPKNIYFDVLEAYIKSFKRKVSLKWSLPHKL